MRQLAVVIGRFQPVHRFHVETLLNRAVQYDSGLVLLGSSLKTRDEKNPLRWELRRDLILSACGEIWGKTVSDLASLAFAPIKDYPYSNNRWVFQVQKTVDEHLARLRALSGEDWEPVLVGVDKDDTTFYLKFFPQWKNDVFAPAVESANVSATDIRKAMFEGNWSSVSRILPPTVQSQLVKWLASAEGRRISQEYAAAQKSSLVLAYRDASGNLAEAPFAPTFHTTDNVVMWRGHVLLIRRRAHPGKGLWALPGGFLEKKEWIKDGAVRELTEETHIQFFMKGSRRRLHISPDWCKNSHVFDHPGRSLRGRTITTAYHWVIPDEFEVVIRRDDDADKVKWFPLYDVLDKMNYELFEDHQSIVAHMALGAHQ
jgi:bifunctional NMN adenylyltransferase/nudix hydrolase